MSLSSVQATNTLIPLLIYPYLIRVIGVEKFGLIALAQASANLFVLLVNYGHNISATQQIALKKAEPGSLAVIVNSVIGSKMVLTLISFVCFGTAIVVIPAFSRERELFWLTSTIILSQGFILNWFFQGIEKMHYQTWLNLLSKLLFASTALVVVYEPEDYILINLLIGIGNLVAGLLGLLVLRFTFGIKAGLRLGGIKEQLIRGWPLFLSNLAGYGSLNVNLIILGLVGTPTTLGYYSIAERIYLAMRSLPVIIYQTVYPTVCQLALGPFDKLLTFYSGLLRVILAMLIPVGLVIFGMADWLIYIFAGESLPQAALLLRIVSFGPLIAALNIPACQTLLAFNFNSGYLKVTLLGAVFNLVMNTLLVPNWMHLGSAFCLMLTETIVTVSLYYYLHRYHGSISVFRIFSI